MRTSFISTTFVSLALFVTPSVLGSNDWTKPCFQGECSYELPAAHGRVSGTLTISGAPDAITDITPAAGWLVVGCEKDSLAQDIRIVCADDSICSHLYNGAGAAGKLVRLPENCGKNAFARIAREWVHKDQRIPEDVSSRLPARKDGRPHEVKAIEVDTNFGAIDSAQTGRVSFTVRGSSLNNGGKRRDTDEIDLFRGRNPHNVTASEFVGTTANEFAKISRKFSKSASTNIPLLDISKSYTIFDQHLTCPAIGLLPAYDVSLSAVANANIHTIMQLGIAISGTIIPPKVEEFALFTGLSADLEASLKVSGSASGIVDSGRIPIFSTGIPGLDFHGILTIGPTFGVDVQAKAELAVNADVTFALSYKTDTAQLFFPASAGQLSTAPFIPKDGHFKISVPASVGVIGKVEGHIIPNVNFGISAFGKLAEAKVYLDLDASAAITLSATETVGSGVRACAGVGAQMDVNAGAKGSFFHVFSADHKFNLFTKKFSILDKCNKPKMVSSVRTLPPASSLNKRANAITCPIAGIVNTLIDVIDEVVPGANIQPLS